MKLLFFKTLWGHSGTWAEAVRKAEAAGFNGIEGPWQEAVLDSPLEWIAEVVTGGDYVPAPGLSPQAHFDELKQGIDVSLQGAPRFINTMCGTDAWDLQTMVRFFEGVLSLEQEYKIPISIETHRSRCTYSPWVVRNLMRELPSLRLNLDFSHWCCVCERLVLNEEPEFLEMCARQGFHLHGRIGYAQGPQVPDPRAPEYEDALLSHLRWWRVVWNSMRERGQETITVTPEFGPDGYLHEAPFSREPVADLWEVNQWMAGRIREELSVWSAEIP
jgi:hypothetical protein